METERDPSQRPHFAGPWRFGSTPHHQAAARTWTPFISEAPSHLTVTATFYVAATGRE